MAVPNLKSATLVVEPERVLFTVTSTSLVEVVAPVATGYAYFLEQVSVSNNGTVSANVTISIRDGSASPAADYQIASKRSVQVKSAFNAAQGRAHILTEGDSLYAKVEASGQSVDLAIPYMKVHEA